jgi:hypothetical protein
VARLKLEKPSDIMGKKIMKFMKFKRQQHHILRQVQYPEDVFGIKDRFVTRNVAMSSWKIVW